MLLVSGLADMCSSFWLTLCRSCEKSIVSKLYTTSTLGPAMSGFERPPDIKPLALPLPAAP